MDKIFCGYVRFDDGLVLLQIPREHSRWGFSLDDDDQTWDGGFGLQSHGEWEAIADDDPRISEEDRDRLQCWLDEARENAEV